MHTTHRVQTVLIHHMCYSVYDPKPFIFLFDVTELVPGPLQLRLQALNANHRLQQILVKICILLLQSTEYTGNTEFCHTRYLTNTLTAWSDNFVYA